MKELKDYATIGSRRRINIYEKFIGQRDALSYETGFQKAGFIGQILE